MTPVETVFGGIIIAIGSGAVGKYLGSNGKVKDKECIEHRKSCSTVLSLKIDNLAQKVEELKKAVNSKLLGL
uniref:Uncharacterized protein n=1 Tax=viral metagenome TaxID=1070528 RepID=A0A6H1ZMG3_9ZZZZ